MKHMLYASFALLATTSIQYNNASINKDATEQIRNACKNWYDQPSNANIVKKFLSPTTNRNPLIEQAELAALLELTGTVEQLEKELIAFGATEIEARLESFAIFCNILCEHISEEERTTLEQLLEIKDPVLNKQLEEAVSSLLLSGNLQDQPETQYFLFMYSLRTELITS